MGQAPSPTPCLQLSGRAGPPGRATWPGPLPPHRVCCFLVGGLRSPWRGEYKEPRHPPPGQGHSHQTPQAQPRELSPGAPGPQPTEDTTGGAPKLQPPLPPEPPERNKSPSLNWGKDESGTWDPLPLSSLDPAPAKNPSSAERKATFPEQELQQLEIGMGGPAATSGSPVIPRAASMGSLLSSLPRGWLPSSVQPDARPGQATPALHSLPLPSSAELFLNSLSQPFSLEEQEQILSCLSVDSLSLSDDSEKVSRPGTQDPGDRAPCQAGEQAVCKWR